eukprot:gb/GFBE01074231.1/.p1 GENE.gb/GFBE01074231.1/~~gb/GFBE01074231.1/.p1  ORF type:complete len:565 (+),score=137.11 gb/GFBE01074231.1/:1-1695(+)
MSMAMMRAKVDAESRQSEEKKAAEKKRNTIVLCMRFFQDQGYINSVQQMQNETNISLDRVDAADNVDLPSIITEYEDFYEMRFGRKPKLTRKVAGDKDMDRKCSLPRLPPDGNSAPAPPNYSEGGSSGSRRRERSSRAKSQEPMRIHEKPPTGQKAELEPSANGKADLGVVAGGEVSLGAQLVVQSVTKSAGGAGAGKKDPERSAAAEAPGTAGEDYYENQVLRALPNYGADKEYRELATNISRDILTKNPGVAWDSIVGLNHAKALLKEAVVMPLKYPQLFTGLLAPWKGVLLFGPPGTGKTLLAKAVATECETTFFNISASTVVSKWRGDSEKLVRVLFDLAKHHQPSTIFIDELDSLMSARGGGDSGGGEHEGSRRMKTELLIQMDGMLRDTRDQVFLLAASNLPWDLDSAMLRRLEKRVLVDLPNAAAREVMFKTNLPEGFAESLDYAKLAGLTEEWSGSDIRLLCKEAAMHPLRRLMAEIEQVEVANAAAAAAQDGKTNRKRAAEKAQEKNAPALVSIDDLKVGAVLNSDVERALQTVHRAPAAHVDRYSEWQMQHGAA